jgi:hypothetical protein
MKIVETTKSLNSNRKLSKLRDVIKEKVLKYIEIRKEEILHLFMEANEFEEFEIDLLIRIHFISSLFFLPYSVNYESRRQLPDKRQLQHDPFIFIY